MVNDEHTHFIYKTTNSITGKFYVGMHSTKNINDGYIGSGKILRRSIAKYGREVHTFEVIEILPNREALASREREIVNEELLTDPRSMNIRLGGEGGGGWTKDQQKTNNRKSQQAQRNLWRENKEWAKHRRETCRRVLAERRSLGNALPKPIPHTPGEFKHTEEAKRKISEANSRLQRGTGNSQHGTCWIHLPEQKINKKIPKTELYQWIDLGWIQGRKMKF